jgi:hypothetical protein
MKFLTLIIITILFSGCATNHWQYRAWQINRNPIYVNYDCKGRTRILIDEMNQEGVDFQVIHGFYAGHPHRWIEIEKEIIDPSIPNGLRRLYVRG